MDRGLVFALAVVTPGAAVFLGAAIARLIWRARGHRDSIVGIRAMSVGLVMLLLVPGVALVVAVATGGLLWSAVIPGLVALLFAVRLGRVGRRYWRQELGAPAAPRDIREH
jgi:hypothetical protein